MRKWYFPFNNLLCGHSANAVTFLKLFRLHRLCFWGVIFSSFNPPRNTTSGNAVEARRSFSSTGSLVGVAVDNLKVFRLHRCCLREGFSSPSTFLEGHPRDCCGGPKVFQLHRFPAGLAVDNLKVIHLHRYCLRRVFLFLQPSLKYHFSNCCGGLKVFQLHRFPAVSRTISRAQATV